MSADAKPRPKLRRAWSPEADDEVATVLRRLMVQPWLVAGRDDESIGAVRRNAATIRDVHGRLGWVLVVERDFIRLRKSPPSRRTAWASAGTHPRTCSWFFLLVAAAESLPPRTGLSSLVLAARAAAAEAGIATTGDIAERRTIANALKELDARGIVETARRGRRRVRPRRVHRGSAGRAPRPPDARGRQRRPRRPGS